MKSRIIKLFIPALLSTAMNAQVILMESNLPIVNIDTDGTSIPEDEKITARMGIIYKGENSLHSIDDHYNNYDGFIGIEVRGSSSLNFPKRQYAIETRDSLGNNLNVSLMGMPEENDWVLYAPYSDKSLMRNVLAYHLSSVFTINHTLFIWSLRKILRGIRLIHHSWIERLKRKDLDS